MKRLIALFIVILVCLNAKSQTLKLFLDTNRNVINDSTKSHFYAIAQKLEGDSAWAGKIYNKRGDALSVGTYKDDKLKIPHGKFVFYGYDLQFNTDSSSHKLFRYLHSTGYYLNGVRSGPWMYFYNDGVKNFMYTYENGKFNGLYERYGREGESIERGQYINDLKEGEWFIQYGKTINAITYKNNQKVDQLDNSSPAVKRLQVAILHNIVINGGPDYDFTKYLNQAISSRIANGIDGVVVVNFTVDKKGKIKRPKIIRKLSDPVDKAITDALLAAPNWRPFRQDGSYISQEIVYHVILINSKIKIRLTHDGQITDPYY
ncbi:hypothetical protein FFF34_006315 [Inquilinus sp. KBS0705]|nr:hypothetical protein FFF34_006315 [Inquilinus sp. KBS0705]